MEEQKHTHELLGTYIIPDENNHDEIILKHLQVQSIYNETTTIHHVFIIWHNNELYSFRTTNLSIHFVCDKIAFHQINNDRIRIYFRKQPNVEDYYIMCILTWPSFTKNKEVGWYSDVQNYINTLEYLFDEDNHNYILK